jgi:hypothetical protein
MTTKTHKALIIAFLDAVSTWKHLVQALKGANQANDARRKSALMRSMFYWRKTAEALKSKLDSLRLV